MSRTQKKICIIDDDEIYLFAVKRVLEINNLSQNILEFHNGQEAMDFFSSQDCNSSAMPDVIFVDINMPVMNGWEFIEEFKKLNPQIPKSVSLCVVSSSVDGSDIEKARSYNVDSYLSKPVLSAHMKEIFSTIPA